MAQEGDKNLPFSKEEPADKIKNIDKLHALKLCSLFGGLSRWELVSISRLTRLVEIKKGEVVYREGETPRSFSIVVSGRFEVFRGSGEMRKVLAYLKQGAYFGEISLLTGGVHSATIQARSDSLILEINKEDFQRKIQIHPSISLEMSRVLSTRLQKGDKPQVSRSDILSVYSAHRRTDHTSFCINLAASLHRETGQRTLLVDMSPTGNVIWNRLKIDKKVPLESLKVLEKGIDQVLSERLVSHDAGVEVLNLATEGAEESAIEDVAHLLNRLAVDFRFIVIDLPSVMNDLIIKLLAQSDQIFLVTDNSMGNVSEIQEVSQELEKSIAISDEKIKIIMNESFFGFSPTNQTKKELFGEKDCYFLPQVSLSGDERLKPEEQPLIVTEHPERDYSKIIRQIARKVSKNLIGVALGSGAALGFAHLGVLKVLDREKIPIDFIAGSSMGALVAAFYSSGKDMKELVQMAEKFSLLRWVSLVDFSLFPIRGIIQGKRLNKFLAKRLRGLTFENTKTPLYIVSTDLAARQPIIMNTGSVSNAVRASIAIPGIFDPIITGDRVVIDGGVIDPLPVTPLIDAGIDKIIAVDVLPTAEDIAESRRWSKIEKDRHAMSMKKKPWPVRALHRAGEILTKPFTPNLPDIIINSMQMMEHKMADVSSADADVLIRPTLPTAHWYEFHRSKDFMIAGEKAAEASLSEIQALVRQQNF